MDSWGAEGSLGQEAVKEIISKVEKFMGEQAREVATMIGVPCEGIEKDFRTVFGKIEKRLLMGLARDAKAGKNTRGDL